MSEKLNMQCSRVELIERLRNPQFAGPMQHLRDWSDIDTLMHRAADLLEEAEHDAIIRAALSKDEGGAG